MAKRKNNKKELKPDQILLSSRQILLYGEINNDKAKELMKKFITLASTNKKKPIYLWINSPGGSIYDGFDIIDCIQGLPCPLVTIIKGLSASMAGLISLYGNERFITQNSYWMAHDGSSGLYDYFEKQKYRFRHTEELQNRIFKILKNKTKLTNHDIKKARTGELWLNANQCLKKGIVDKIKERVNKK